MSVVAPPPHDELEALIREARARQRRRWRGAAAAIVALAAATGLVSVPILSGGPKAEQAPKGGRSPLTSAPRCRSDDLRLAGRFDGAGTGQVRSTFTFTNVSLARCVLRGWPTLRVVLRANRSATARLARRNGANRPLVHPTVALGPGGTASFEVLSSDGIGLTHACPGAREVVVTPPGAQAPLRLPSRLIAYCGPGYLWVTPVVAGRTDHRWS